MKAFESYQNYLHIGIPTNKFEQSLEFYKALGMEHFQSEKNGECRVAFLKAPNVEIEIYEQATVSMQNGAIDHMAFYVDDVKKVYESVIADKIGTLDMELSELPFGQNGVRFFLIKGPNNERVEFIQKL